MSRCNRRDCFMEDLLNTAEQYVKGFFVLFSVILGAMFLMIYYFLNYICNKQNETSVARDIDAIQAQQELMNSMLPITRNKDSNYSQYLPQKKSNSKSSKKEKKRNSCCECSRSNQSFLSEKEIHNTVIAGNNKVGAVSAGNYKSGTMLAGSYNAGTMPAGNYKAETVPAGNYKAETMQAGNYKAETVPAGNYKAETVPAGNYKVGTGPAGNYKVSAPAGNTYASESSNGNIMMISDNFCELNSTDEDMLLEPKKEPKKERRSFNQELEPKQELELEGEISPSKCAKCCISKPTIPTQSCCSLCCPASKR